MSGGGDVGAAAAVGVAAVVVVPVGLVVGLAMLMGGAQQQAEAAQACAARVVPAGAPGPSSPPPGPVPQGSAAGYSGVQLGNAAEIRRAGVDQGLSERDQTIGVMAAMGESGLRVLEFGDGAGPDSRGLFQQRAQGWGSLADRMNPYISSWNFFAAEKKILGRDLIPPTKVANLVQHNADPYHYEPFWGPAGEVMEHLKVSAAGRPAPSASTAGTGAPAAVAPDVAQAVALDCPAGVDPAVAGGDLPVTGEWGQPGAGPVMSPYGRRNLTLPDATGNWHTGLDLQAGGCKGPIYAAAAGTVSTVYADSYGGWTVHLDHGAGVTTSYKHMYPAGIFVRVGNVVKAGQRIAEVGSSGFSTGCHLHFEVIVKGQKINPSPFMAARGVVLGAP